MTEQHDVSTPSLSEIPSDRLALEVEYDPHVSRALVASGVPLVKALRLRNLADEPFEGLRIVLFAEPGLSTRLELPVPLLDAHAASRFDTVSLPLSPERLAEPTTDEAGKLWIEVFEGEDVLLRTAYPLQTLDAGTWPGPRSLPEILAAFVLPFRPATARVLASAGRHLEAATTDPALDGYERRDPARVQAALEAVYQALADLALSPSPIPTPNLEAEGAPLLPFAPEVQALRSPEEIESSKTVTGLELAVLFASAIEGAGLHPLVVLLGDRALVGVWLEEERFVDPAIDELMRIRKRLDLESILVFDPAGVVATPAGCFEDAVAQGAKTIADASAGAFLYAVDVRAARRAGILPLVPIASSEDAAPDDVPAEPADSEEEEFQAPEPKGPLPRVERWKHRLLDLSLRNRLLNHRTTKKTIPIERPDLGRLEDLLSEGKKFRLLPERTRASATEGGTPDEEEERAARDRDLEAGRLRTTFAGEDLERRLTQIYRAARLSLQEGGANTLYLAIGFLHWYETPSSTIERVAPILLYPLVMTRRSIAEGTKGYRIEIADDEPQVNVTLLQKLESEFELRVSGLADLDTDESGLDVPRILERFAKAVRPMPRWKIGEEAAVGLFSFTKYLMWLDLDRRADVLTRNDVVRHLLETPGEPFGEDVEFPDPSSFDMTRSPTDTFIPMPADSSQQTAVFAAADGHTFVLEGPPGTGKSQTITNLICHALATSKRVLFVSEKIAALNVVHKRLARVGVAPFCLELHSNKTRKRSVLEQLRSALDVAGTAAPEAWPRVAERLEAVRIDVNAHTDALHEVRSFGRSAFYGLSRLIALRGVPRVRLDAFGAHDAVDRDGLEVLEVAVRAAKVALAEVGDVREHAWRACNLDEWGPSLPGRVEEIAPKVADAASDVERAAAALADDLGIEATGLSRRDVGAANEAAALFAKSPIPTARLLTDPAFDLLRERIQGWIGAGRVVEGHKAALGTRWNEGILALDLSDVQHRLERSRKTFWPFSWFRARHAKKQLKGVLLGGKLAGTDTLLEDLEQAVDWKQRCEEIKACDTEARELLGGHWRGLDTDWARLDDTLTWTASCRALLARLADRAPDGLEGLRARFTVLAADGPTLLAEGTAAGRRRRHLAETLTELETCKAEAAGAFELDATLAWGAEDEASYAARVRSTASAWLAAKAGLRDWCAWVRARTGLDGAKLTAVREAVEDGRLGPENIEDVFEHSFMAWWVEALFEVVPVLRRFRGPEQLARIDEFRRLDGEVMDTTEDVVLSRLAATLPTGRAAAASKSDSSEMGILHRELRKRRNMPIRRLFDRIPNVLSRLKPCMLMSPLSVAQYLGPDFPAFDLVVFDEASQIPPWDAVGAIARGEKLVVVGDSKQLPPTNFFQRSQEGDDLDDEDDLREMESILDECLAAQLPSLHLGWHYRSRHESLIAYSNHQYYEDRLYTFPSSIDVSPRMGVTWHHVEEGVYDRGRSRTNRPEAEALVAEVVKRLTDPEKSKRTLGVVTFSIAQASLVEDLLEQARREHPEIEPFFDDAHEEPVFVKNLENVQGDERDVIFLSVCYGPDREGRVALNFGPLNRDGGERRLNVAVTRAREQVIVFSTLRAEQIDLARTRARGARDLKAYLEYAEQGTSTLGQGPSLADDATATVAFEDTVRSGLEENGWTVKPRVGCSAYRIDLGVEDPDEEGRFLTAVETDGVTYGRAATARDRHGTRPFVLRHLGWEHVRIWSTDWWQDPRGELAKLVQTLEEARAARRQEEAKPEPEPEAPPTADDSEPTEKQASETEPASEAAEPPGPSLGILLGGTPYRRTRLEARSGEPRHFYEDRAIPMIVRRIEKIIEAEAPVALDVVARRLADVWGLKRITSRLADRVRHLMARVGTWRFSADSTEFFWRRDQDPKAYTAFRVPDRGGKPERRARHIPPEEIAGAAARLLAEHVSIDTEDLARETARLFGYRRITEKVQAPMLAGVELLVSRGGARLEGDRVRLP